jgi:outer membrane protein, adhesin transport system
MESLCRRLTVSLAAVILMAGTCSAAPLTLPDAIDRAIKFAPSMEAAAAQSEMTSAQVREQRAPLFPNISTGGEYYNAPGYNDVVTNRALSAAMVMATYTAWDWGRRAAKWRAARYVAEAARLGVAAAQAQIAYDATVAYEELFRAHESSDELRTSLARLDRYVATIEALGKSGRANASDVLKVRTARDAVEIALEQQRVAIQRAAANLGSLIGEFNQPDLEIADLGGVPAKPATDIAGSPVIQATARALSSAGLQVQAAKAERLPTFQVAFTTGFVGIDPPETWSHNFGGSYDTVLSMPIFDGGLITSHIDQAKAKVASAKAQARDTEYTLTRRITDASIRFDQANRMLDLLAHAQPTADDSFALSWTRFLGGGSVTLLEVLDAYQRAEDLRLQRLEEEFALREAAAEINLLCGRIR